MEVSRKLLHRYDVVRLGECKCGSHVQEEKIHEATLSVGHRFGGEVGIGIQDPFERVGRLKSHLPEVTVRPGELLVVEEPAGSQRAHQSVCVQ